MALTNAFFSKSGMVEVGGKLGGSEHPLHLFNEKAEPLRLVYIFPVKGLSQDPGT